MKKSLLLILSLLLVSASFAPAATAQKRKGRVAKVEYHSPMFSNDIPLMLDCFAPANAGCIRIDGRPGEKYVKVVVQDAISANVVFEVGGWLYCNKSPRLWLDPEGNSEDKSIIVYVLPDNHQDTCPEGASATRGVITATFTRKW